MSAFLSWPFSFSLLFYSHDELTIRPANIWSLFFGFPFLAQVHARPSFLYRSVFLSFFFSSSDLLFADGVI